MRKPVHWDADAECLACKGTGFREHRVVEEDCDGHKFVAEVFRVVCSCVELTQPPL